MNMNAPANTCRVCGIQLNSENCPNRKKSGAICKKCHCRYECERRKRRIAADPDYEKKRWARRKDTHNTSRRAWNAAHKDAIRRRNYKTKFDKTPEEIDLMFAKQGKVCAICGEIPRNGVPSVDHIHGTKIIRGLLCDRCNAGIGMFLDDPHRLYKAMVYLSKWAWSAKKTA